MNDDEQPNAQHRTNHIKDDYLSAEDVDVNQPRNALERLLLLSHSAVRPDFLLVTVSRRTQAFWQSYADTGPFELAAKKAGKHGWFVTSPDGHVLVERRTVAAEYLGNHSTMAVDAPRVSAGVSGATVVAEAVAGNVDGKAGEGAVAPRLSVNVLDVVADSWQAAAAKFAARPAYPAPPAAIVDGKAVFDASPAGEAVRIAAAEDGVAK